MPTFKSVIAFSSSTPPARVHAILSVTYFPVILKIPSSKGLSTKLKLVVDKAEVKGLLIEIFELGRISVIFVFDGTPVPVTNIPTNRFNEFESVITVEPFAAVPVLVIALSVLFVLSSVNMFTQAVGALDLRTSIEKSSGYPLFVCVLITILLVIISFEYLTNALFPSITPLSFETPIKERAILFATFFLQNLAEYQYFVLLFS